MSGESACEELLGAPVAYLLHEGMGNYALMDARERKDGHPHQRLDPKPLYRRPDALIAEVERLRALELRVRALTTEPGCRHDGETYCGNAILEALDDPTPTPPVRPVDGGNP